MNFSVSSTKNTSVLISERYQEFCNSCKLPSNSLRCPCSLRLNNFKPVTWLGYDIKFYEYEIN